MAETKDDKVFDIAKPGKSAADPTARPIIVGQGTMLSHDPMVSDDKDSKKTDVKLGPPRTKMITPPSTEVAATDTTISEQISSDSAVVDAVIDQADKKDKRSNSEFSEEDRIKRQHMAAMIADKTYFLPIGQATRKKNARNSASILLLLALLSGGAYWAYIMGYLQKLR